MKRIILFVATNLAIVLILSIVLPCWALTASLRSREAVLT